MSNPQVATHASSADCTLPLQARRHPAIARVRRALVHDCRLRRPDGSVECGSIVLGVSGGADSLALLVAILALGRHADPPSLQPHVVCVHHHLRAETDREVEHVRSIASRFDVPFTCIDVYPGGESGNIAAAARRLRYEALGRAASEIGASLVAVGHHADDQFETILMMLCRGGGIRTLGGMRARRRLLEIGDRRIDLIRPLLRLRRGDCESLCQAAGVEWIDDPTNRDPSRARGRLRRDVIPALESLWPGAVRHAARLAREAQSSARRQCRVERIVDLLLKSMAPLAGDDAPRGGDPKSVFRLRRGSLRSAPRDVVEMILRRAAQRAVALAGGERGVSEADGRIACALIEQIAQAVADSEVRPRVFQVSENLAVRVTSQCVEFLRVDSRK